LVLRQIAVYNQSKTRQVTNWLITNKSQGTPTTQRDSAIQADKPAENDQGILKASSDAGWKLQVYLQSFRRDELWGLTEVDKNYEKGSLRGARITQDHQIWSPIKTAYTK